VGILRKPPNNGVEPMKLFLESVEEELTTETERKEVQGRDAECQALERKRAEGQLFLLKEKVQFRPQALAREGEV
jgi:uncharacterized protein (DUF169 family)